MQIALADGAILTVEPEGRAVHLEISRLRGAWLSARELRETAAKLLVLAEDLDSPRPQGRVRK